MAFWLFDYLIKKNKAKTTMAEKSTASILDKKVSFSYMTDIREDSVSHFSTSYTKINVNEKNSVKDF